MAITPTLQMKKGRQFIEFAEATLLVNQGWDLESGSLASKWTPHRGPRVPVCPQCQFLQDSPSLNLLSWHDYCGDPFHLKISWFGCSILALHRYVILLVNESQHSSSL